MHKRNYHLMLLVLSGSISLSANAASLQKYQEPNMPEPVQQMQPVERSQPVTTNAPEPDIYQQFRQKIEGLSDTDRKELEQLYTQKADEAKAKKDAVAEDYYRKLVEILKEKK
jgi:hypothetical protein